MFLGIKDDYFHSKRFTKRRPTLNKIPQMSLRYSERRTMYYWEGGLLSSGYIRYLRYLCGVHVCARLRHYYTFQSGCTYVFKSVLYVILTPQVLKKLLFYYALHLKPEYPFQIPLLRPTYTNVSQSHRLKCRSKISFHRNLILGCLPYRCKEKLRQLSEC